MAWAAAVQQLAAQAAEQLAVGPATQPALAVVVARSATGPSEIHKTLRKEFGRVIVQTNLGDVLLIEVE